jgi:hypothetical protein
MNAKLSNAPFLIVAAVLAVVLSLQSAVLAQDFPPSADAATQRAAKTDEAASDKKPAPKPKQPRIILGRIEYVVLQDVHIRLKARIDTGAGLSSLHVKILEITKTPEGDERVRFQIDDGQGGHKTLSRKVVDWANIKVMGSEERNRRPIVRLDVCIGGKQIEGRVTLSDREGFLYPVLIGRNLLNTGKFLVDPGAKYLRDPGCE